MITRIHIRARVGKGLALGLLLATLFAMVLSGPPVDAATPSSKAFAWGYNSEGQLGNGTTGTDSNLPVAVKNLESVKSVKAGCDHGLALKRDGTVRAWGYNNYGQLGNGTRD